MHTIAVGDIDTLETGQLSLMPPGLVDRLPSSELADLLPCLAALGR